MPLLASPLALLGFVVSHRGYLIIVQQFGELPSGNDSSHASIPFDPLRGFATRVLVGIQRWLVRVKVTLIDTKKPHISPDERRDAATGLYSCRIVNEDGRAAVSA